MGKPASLTGSYVATAGFVTTPRSTSTAFERITELDGHARPVMESGDLLRQPEAMVKAYCTAVGIPFIAEALYAYRLRVA